MKKAVNSSTSKTRRSSLRARRLGRAASGLVSLAIFGVATSLLASDPDEPATERYERSRKVVVAQVARTEARGERRLFGTTRAAHRSTLSFTVGGRLQARPVKVGARVERGQVLARLDSAPLRHAARATAASLRKLDAELAQGKRDRARAEALWTDDALPQRDMEQARSGVEALVAARDATASQLSEAKRLVRETTLKAPYDAQVVEVFLEPGEFAAPGAPIVTLSGKGGVELRVEAPEAVVPRLTEGAEVLVDFPMLRRRGVKGRVKSIGEAASRPGSLFPILVVFDDTDGVRSGVTAELVLETRQDEALSVPAAAVLDPSGHKPAVMRVHDGKVHRVPVTIDGLDGDRVRVRGALEPGQDVVVGGHAFLLDGDRVETS